MRIKCDIYISAVRFLESGTLLIHNDYDVIKVIGKHNQKGLTAFIISIGETPNITRYPCSSDLRKIFYFQDSIGVTTRQNNQIDK